MTMPSAKGVLCEVLGITNPDHIDDIFADGYVSPELFAVEKYGEKCAKYELKKVKEYFSAVINSLNRSSGHDVEALIKHCKLSIDALNDGEHHNHRCADKTTPWRNTATKDWTDIAFCPMRKHVLFASRYRKEPVYWVGQKDKNGYWNGLEPAHYEPIAFCELYPPVNF